MGIELKNPIVVGACSLSKQIDTIKQIEAAGAGALVLKSILRGADPAGAWQARGRALPVRGALREAVTLFPAIEHGARRSTSTGSRRQEGGRHAHLRQHQRGHRRVVAEYAIQLADTGVDGLELNFYSMPLDPRLTSNDIEQRELQVFTKIREAVRIPIAVKLHPTTPA